MSTRIALIAVAAIFLVLVGCSQPQSKPGKEQLMIYCGAGLRAPVEAVAKEYERDTGVSIYFQFGPSQALVAQAEVSHSGDLLLPGDDAFITLAREKGLISNARPLARMAPVLAVRKGNPRQIKSLDDLAGDVQLAIPTPESTATGRLVQEAMQKSGDWERVKSRAVVFKGTVSDVANDIKIGSVDAGFVWDAMLAQYPDLEALPIQQLEGATALVSVGSLKSSRNPAAAEQFAQYLAAEGQRVFREFGFKPAEGEK